MNKEKEIEGMAKVIVNFKEKHDIPLGVGFHSVDLSKHIIEAGYRKAEEVRKETAKEILDVLQTLYREAQGISRKDVIYRIGAVDALQNAIDTIRNKFGMEGE